ncbi:MAG: plastocyanin/azurin family copper-binding protein [Chloroflexota bacterium]
MLTRILRLAAASALSGSLVLAALVLAPVAGVSAGGGCHAENGAVHNEGETSVVRMDVCTFEPTVARVDVGTEVRFLNTSAMFHVVTGERQSWGSQGELRQGEELRQTFDRAGIYPYSCPLHPGMVGAIVVGDPDAAAAAPLGDSAPAGAADATAAGSTDAGLAPALLLAVGLAAVAGVVSMAALLTARRRTASTATQ